MICFYTWCFTLGLFSVLWHDCGVRSAAWRRNDDTANFSFDFSFFFLFAGRFVNLLCVAWDAHLPWFIKLFHFLPLESWFYSALKRLYCLLLRLSIVNFTKFWAKLQRRCLHPLQVEAVYRSNLIRFIHTYRSPKWTCIHFILLLCKTEVTDTSI